MFRKRYKRITAGLAITGTMALALAGCSASTASTTSSPAHGTITFVTYEGGAAGAKWTQLIKSFEAANPGDKVKMEVEPGDATYDNLVKSRIQGGNAPDVFEVVNGLPGELPYVKAGLLKDLSNQAWSKKLIPAIAAYSASTDNRTYTFTTSINTVGVYYNKSIFTKYGVSVPKDWNAFLAAVKKFRAAGVTPLSLGAKDGWPLPIQISAMISSEPGYSAAPSKEAPSLLSGKLAFSKSAAWQKVTSDFASLVKMGAYDQDASGVTWPSSATEFANGNTAMMLQVDAAIPAIRTANPGLDFGDFVLPYVHAGQTPAVPIGGSAMLAIPAKAKNSALAEKFLDYLATPSVMKRYLQTAVALSSLKGITPKADPAVEELLPALNKKAVDFTLAQGTDAATTAAETSGLQAMVAGSGSASDLLNAMDRAQTTN
jgi:raffinose/stachyose/melibiose transport system substrate-binding protein